MKSKLSVWWEKHEDKPDLIVNIYNKALWECLDEIKDNPIKSMVVEGFIEILNECRPKELESFGENFYWISFSQKENRRQMTPMTNDILENELKKHRDLRFTPDDSDNYSFSFAQGILMSKN